MSAATPSGTAATLEPVAHMYPSDLERFAESETFATAFSVPVGNPDERSVPLFPEGPIKRLEEVNSCLLAALQVADRTFAESGLLACHAARQEIRAAIAAATGAAS